jgi:SAM-dependent methyltransferase
MTQNQNIYDQVEFFDNYSRLPRSQKGLAGSPEWPELRSMVGEVKGNRVLDLGCGYGWFSRWALESGAAGVEGVDLSEKMLDRARELSDNDTIKYSNQDLDTIEPRKASYELVYSSLTLHYLVDIRRLISEVFKSLTPGGRFVFSAEHPIFTAPIQHNLSFFEDKGVEGHKVWPLNSYADEGTRIRNWLSEGVKKQHWKIESYVSAILDAGFTLTALREWMPTVEDIKDHPEWAAERERPMFLLISAVKLS